MWGSFRKKTRQRSSTIVVANWFVNKGVNSLAPLKYQKLVYLCYYAHVWHLVLYPEDKRICEEGFAAGLSNPYNKTLHSSFSAYGWDSINTYMREDEISVSKLKVLCEVWDVYGGLDPMMLRSLYNNEAVWGSTSVGKPIDEVLFTHVYIPNTKTEGKLT